MVTGAQLRECERGGCEYPVTKRLNNRDTRIAAGLCGNCGEPRGVDATKTECRRHARARNTKVNKRRAELREWRRRRGLCIRCGGELDGTRKDLCQDCAFKQSINEKNHRHRRLKAA